MHEERRILGKTWKQKNQKEFLELKNTTFEIKNSLSIKRKFGNIGKWICEHDDRLIEITQTELWKKDWGKKNRALMTLVKYKLA